jgi:hypothetical protein
MFGRERFSVDFSPVAIPQSVIAQPKRVLPYVTYRLRRRSLPNTFTLDDWERALDYWGYACAVCARPRGLWHTISQDHWVPLTSPDCPGTVPSNMLPLCYGADGCNNSKGKKDPALWLVEKLGKRKGKKKWAEIETYFGWVAQFQVEPEYDDSLGCPDCGASLFFGVDTGLWHCDGCGAAWRERQD